MGVTDAVEAAARAAGERSAEIEKLRHLPQDLVDQLAEARCFHQWVPEKYGGEQAHVNDLLDIIEEVSYHDGSAGWCVMIAGTTALNASRLTPEWAETIYGDPAACTGGYGMPAGRALPTDDGGLRVTGQWQWGSGTDHCTWIGGGVLIVDEDGKPTPMPDGTATCFAYFEPSDVEFVDNWHVSGLKGTASCDYKVADVVVPAGRWADFLGSGPNIDAPLYRFSLLSALATGVSAVTIGLARRAIDELIELGQKKPSGSSRSLAERGATQADLAKAQAAVEMSKAYLTTTVNLCWEAAVDGSFGDQQRKNLRLAANAVTERCAHAVDLCYHAGGGTSVFEDSALQRCFRDVHVATQHGMVAPRVNEPLGRMGFGLPTDTRQL